MGTRVYCVVCWGPSPMALNLVCFMYSCGL